MYRCIYKYTYIYIYILPIVHIALECYKPSTSMHMFSSSNYIQLLIVCRHVVEKHSKIVKPCSQVLGNQLLQFWASTQQPGQYPTLHIS